MTEIAIFGLWHQGVIAAASLASNVNHVTGLSNDQTIVSLLSKARSPIFETDLDQLLESKLNAGFLSFGSPSNFDFEKVEFIFLSHDIPTKENEPDLTEFLDDFDYVTDHCNEKSIIIISAQIPVTLFDDLDLRVRGQFPEKSLNLCYIPENLRLGSAIDRFMNPQLPVVGSDNKKCFERLVRILPKPSSWQLTTQKNAIMLKHALNSMLGASICFANEIDSICRRVGANGFEVLSLLKLEPRIGRQLPLAPGLGFSGGTLARDLALLQKISNQTGSHSLMIGNILRSNEMRNENLFASVLELCDAKSIENVAILGLTYKASSSTLREAASVKFLRRCEEKKLNIAIFDPNLDRFDEANVIEGMNMEPSVMDAVSKAGLICIFNDSQEILDFDPANFFTANREVYVFDPMRYLDVNTKWIGKNFIFV
jgi:UDPglucose 6-dehydrogenase